MSEEDIAKGSLSMTELTTQLQGSKAGVLCITPDSATSPWLNFEAGALSKTIDKPFVCPYLLPGLKATDVKGPVSLLQAAEANQPDTRRMMTTKNGARFPQRLIMCSSSLDVALESMASGS
jgi:hypothetical protein